MDPEQYPHPQRPPSAGTIRRRTAAVLTTFVVASTALHFALGPELTKLSPHWSANDLSDQVVSVVTLSHKEEMPPIEHATPTPPPPPAPLPRTKRDLSVLKYREMGLDVRMRSIRPPARHHSTIVIDHAVALQTHIDTREAKVVAPNPEPTPEATERPGPARIDTGGDQNDLAGSVQWGDDNPVRLLKSAPLGVDDRTGATARVQVDIDPDGKVVDVQLLQSSGDPNVDQAALAAARASTYAPATANGVPVHGSIEVDFPAPAQST